MTLTTRFEAYIGCFFGNLLGPFIWGTHFDPFTFKYLFTTIAGMLISIVLLELAVKLCRLQWKTQ